MEVENQKSQNPLQIINNNRANTYIERVLKNL